MTQLLLTLLEEFKDKMKSFGDGVVRDKKFPEIPEKVMVTIGMRRTGKTYFLFQTIHHLLKQVPLSRILYLNFEDDRLYPLTSYQFAELIDNFYALYPENHDQLCYFFFDEIQNVEEWHRLIRRYLDTKNVKIYLTGSSAKLLSKEIATTLRGRSVAIEMWPFAFDEFLRGKKIALPEQPWGQKSMDPLKGWLNSYLLQGGFPETVFLEQNEDRVRLLQDYVSVVVFRDIVERYKITNVSLVRYMIKTLIKNVGSRFSINKFFNDLKSQSFVVSKTTLHKYLGYIEDAYLVFSVPLHAESLRKVQTNPRKIYAIDTGLVNAYTMGFAKNLGHQFENLVYLDLRRRGHTIHYYLTKTRREVDFVTLDPQGNWHLYQVCWAMEDAETREREESALKEAEEELGIKGEIITPESYLVSFMNWNAISL